MKTALITGASHGIGKAAARQLAQAGYRLFLNCRTSVESLTAYAKELTETYHVECTPVACDISDHAQVAAMFQQIEDSHDAIDVLINNAGISHIGLLQDMSIDEWNRVINTNLTSVFSCCKYAIPHMVAQKQGKIINISSVSGILGNVGQANYAASKAGVIGLTKTMARELGSRGITVNAIAPGFVDTEMTEVLSEEIRENACRQIILGRFGKPEDIANVAVFLASDKADYITGQVISVDGGMNV